MDGNSPDRKRISEPISEKRLTSWKEIAAQLGVSVRSAQAYERTRGLPVQRDGYRVSITERALLEWQNGRFSPPEAVVQPPGYRRLLWGGLALLLCTAGWIAWNRIASRLHAQPSAVRWTGATLTAVDAAGQPLWRHTFPLPVFADLSGAPVPSFLDLDHDGNVEVLTVHPHVQRESKGWDLYCFSHSGDLRWRLAVTRTVSSARASFSPPYVLREFVAFPSPERDATLWTAAVFVHHALSPAVLMVLDSSGRVRGEFWQDGHFFSMRAADLDGDGISEILAAGIQATPAQASLVVLDSRNVGGIARLEREDSPRQLRGMPRGSEKATVYFPRSALNLLTDPFNFIHRLDLVGGSIQASVIEHLGIPQGYLLYSLDFGLRVTHVAASASLDAAILREARDPRHGASLRPDFDALARQVRVIRWP